MGVLIRSAVQPGVDLADAGFSGAAAVGGGLAQTAFLVRRAQRAGRRGRVRDDVGRRIPAAFQVHAVQAGILLDLTGRGLALIGLHPQTIHLVAVLVRLITMLVQGGRAGRQGAGLGLRGARQQKGRDGDGEDQGAGHGAKMALSPAISKRGRNPLPSGRFDQATPAQPRSPPMSASLAGKTVAVLATDGFEQVELLEPGEALKAAGATVEVVSLKAGTIQGFNHLTPDRKIPVDRVLSETDGGAYDALLLPGGVANPDQLRADDQALAFVRSFFDAGKPVAAICHAPWLLIDAGVAEGRTLTSYKSIRTDLRNAGANVVDEAVVVDDGLVTSRCPDDIPAFNGKMIEIFAEGRRHRQTDGARSQDDVRMPS